MDNQEVLDLAAKVDIIIANGVVYYVDRVDYDEQVVHCSLVGGMPCCILALNLVQGFDVKYYMETK